MKANALLTASPDGRIEVKELLAEDGGDSLDKVLCSESNELGVDREYRVHSVEMEMCRYKEKCRYLLCR